MLHMQRVHGRRVVLVECMATPLAPDTRRLPGLSSTVLMAPWAPHRALQCLLVHVTWESKGLSLVLCCKHLEGSGLAAKCLH